MDWTGLKPKDATGCLAERLQIGDGAGGHESEGGRQDCWGCNNLDCDPQVRQASQLAKLVPVPATSARCDSNKHATEWYR